jgi:phage terminase small subunit
MIDGGRDRIERGRMLTADLERSLSLGSDLGAEPISRHANSHTLQTPQPAGSDLRS